MAYEFGHTLVPWNGVQCLPPIIMLELRSTIAPACSSHQLNAARIWIMQMTGKTHIWPEKTRRWKKCLNEVRTRATQPNRFSKRARFTRCCRSYTFFQSSFVPPTIKFYPPHWSFDFFHNHTSHSWENTAAKLPTQHLCTLMGKVFCTNWVPFRLSPQLQYTGTCVFSIDESNRVCKHSAVKQ